MTAVNPEILLWARETAGLDLASAAHKIGLKAARGVAGEDRLAALEAGEGEPSAALLGRMAKQYRRPLLTFYLPTIPRSAEIGEDFRTLPEPEDPNNILLSVLLRDVRARQSLVRDLLDDEDETPELKWVGAYEGIRDSRRLSEILTEVIKFDRGTYRASVSVGEAFNYLRSLVESAGVFVLLAGDAGHWKTAIDVKVFRGYALSDPVAPFVVINDQDARTAWTFTLLHEVAHLLLGKSGISGGNPTGWVEKLCNDTAADTLVDADEIAALPINGPDDEIHAITTFAATAKVSRSMVAYQLQKADRITFDRWEELRDHFRAQWVEMKERQRRERSPGDGGPNYFVVRRHRLGTALLEMARQGMADGSLTPTRAARMLGVKPMSVYPLLARPLRRGGAV